MTRVDYLDLTKCFAILCVLLGHTWQWSYPGDPYEDSRLFQFIYSFHMPLFMTVCGFFLSRSLSLSPLAFARRRATQLLLPVASFSALWLALDALALAPLAGRPREDALAYLAGGDMWFLKYLFVCLAVAYASKRLLRLTWLAALLPTLLLFCLTHSGVFRLLPYLWLGHALGLRCGWWGPRHPAALLGAGAVFALCLCFWHGSYDGNHRFVWLGAEPRVDWGVAAVSFFRLLTGCAGSLFFLALFRRLEPSLPRGAARSWLLGAGRRTLGIYCLQIYLLERLGRAVPLPAGCGTLTRLAVFVAEAVVLNALVSLIGRWRPAALLLLGKEGRP